MQIILYTLLIATSLFAFIFLIALPLVGLYVGIKEQVLDEKKYGLEGARYLRGHGGRGY